MKRKSRLTNFLFLIYKDSLDLPRLFFFSLHGPVIRARVSDNPNIYRPKPMIQSVWRIDNSYEALLDEGENKRLS